MFDSGVEERRKRSKKFQARQWACGQRSATVLFVRARGTLRQKLVLDALWKSFA